MTTFNEFLVIRVPSNYNIILDHPTLSRLGAVHSTYYHYLKFPIPVGTGCVVILRSDCVVAAHIGDVCCRLAERRHRPEAKQWIEPSFAALSFIILQCNYMALFLDVSSSFPCLLFHVLLHLHSICMAMNVTV